MNFARWRENYAARCEIPLFAMIEFGQTSLKHDIKRSKIVGVPRNLEKGRMRCLSSKQTCDLLFTEVILLQSPHRLVLIVVLCSNVVDGCRHNTPIVCAGLRSRVSGILGGLHSATAGKHSHPHRLYSDFRRIGAKKLLPRKH